MARKKDRTPVPADTSTVAPVPDPVGNPLAGMAFWVDPNSQARLTADAWRLKRPTDAQTMDKVAAQPTARWFGNWTSDVGSEIAAATSMITASGSVPVFVAYNIPQRDCGGLSGGNKVGADAYRRWIDAFANGIGARRAVVILEPDALAGMDCLSASDQSLRL
jgi:endoglucanase